MKNYGYWIMIGIGLFLSLILCGTVCKKEKLNFKNILMYLPFAVLCGIIGAEIFGIVSYGMYLVTSGLPLTEIFKNSGWVFYGGMIGFVLTVFKIKQLTERQKDLTVCCFVLFHSVARIGCYFAGCCYGNLIPVQLVESGFVFFCFLTVFYLFLKKKQNIVFVYLVSYSVGRFIIEFFRSDTIRGVYILSFSQWISLFVLLFVGVHKLIKKAKLKK